MSEQKEIKFQWNLAQIRILHPDPEISEKE